MQELLADARVVRFGQVYLLLLLRVLPIVTWSPLFGGLETPATFRMGVSMVLALLCALPLAAAGGPGLSADLMVALAVKELFLGVSIALALRLVFELFAGAGALIDVARGATIANVLDPVGGQQRSLLNVAFSLGLTTLFLSAGGQRVLIEVLGRSLIELPPTELLPVGSRAYPGAGAAFEALSLLKGVFSTTVRLATPAIAILLVADVALGLLNRAAPRIQVFFLGLTLKGTLGIWILFATAPLVFPELLEAAFRAVARIFRT